jgi:hypothetical protein
VGTRETILLEGWGDEGKEKALLRKKQKKAKGKRVLNLIVDDLVKSPH